MITDVPCMSAGDIYQCGRYRQPPCALALALQRDAAAHGDFPEIYQAALANPAMQDAHRQAEAQLPR